tara:strand:- start:2671 stop:2856 length:186 start_codon:yes stop_codon:yes gene_type:complete
MEKGGDSSSSDRGEDSFIVKVTGKSSKTITIPDTVCEFLGVEFGDLLKLKIQDKKRGKKKK